MEGFLYKRGRGRNFSFVKPWAHRYFQLDTDTKELSYFRMENRVKEKKGTINVNNCEICERTGSSAGKPFIFEIITAKNTALEEILTLAAPDECTLKSWLEVLSFGGLNSVRRKTDEKSAFIAATDNSAEMDHVSTTNPLEGYLFKKTRVDSLQAPCGGVWVKRGFVLDPSRGALLFYNEVGSRHRLVDQICVTAGSLQDCSEVETGRPHSFILKSRGESIASNEVAITLAALDADLKNELLCALSSVMGCVVAPAGSCVQQPAAAVGATISVTDMTDGRRSLQDLPNSCSKSVPRLAMGNSKTAVASDNECGIQDYSSSMQHVSSQQFRHCAAADMRTEASVSMQRDISASLGGLLEKIRERLNNGSGADAQGAQRVRQSRERKASDRMTLALKNVQQQVFPEHYIRDKIESNERKKSLLGPIASTTTTDQSLTGAEVNNALDNAALDAHTQSFRVEVIKVLTPCKRARKYLFVKELFSHSNGTVDIEELREKLTQFEDDYISLKLHKDKEENDTLLNNWWQVSNGRCTFKDFDEYFQTHEPLNRDCEVSEVNIVIAVCFDSIGYYRRLSCSLVNWCCETIGKLCSDPLLSEYSAQDVQCCLERQDKHVMLSTSDMLKRDQLEIDTLKFSTVFPFVDQKAAIIEQVVRNYDKRSTSQSHSSPQPNEYSPHRRVKRAAPRTPPPVKSPVLVKSCIKKPIAGGTEFVPPPPRRPQLSGPADVEHVQETFSKPKPAFSASEGDESSARLTCQPRKKQDTTDFSMSPNSTSPFPTTVNDECEQHLPGGLACENNKHGQDDQAFITFTREVLKNKWCTNSLKRLAAVTTLTKILDSGGNCVNFISKCCPPMYLLGDKKKGKKLSKNIGMSAFWLETIATKLGTFWPVSEREFLVETMYANDSDGEQHVRWLSSLISLVHDTMNAH